MHVGDLDGTGDKIGGSGTWEATVVVTIHDGFHNGLSGVEVTGDWSEAFIAGQRDEFPCTGALPGKLMRSYDMVS